MTSDQLPVPGVKDGAIRPRWSEVFRSALAHMKSNRVNIAAGAFAYRWFLAIFPIIIALLGVATLVTVPRNVVVSLIHGVAKSLPSGAAQVFTVAISHTAQRTGADLWTTLVASVVALWSATSGMVMVEEGLDMAYGLPSDRSFLAKRLVAAPLLLGATVLGGGASALVIFGPQLGSLIKEFAPFAGSAFATVWTILRWVIALALMTLLFSILYYVAPNQPRRRWRWTSPGARSPQRCGPWYRSAFLSAPPTSDLMEGPTARSPASRFSSSGSTSPDSPFWWGEKWTPPLNASPPRRIPEVAPSYSR